MHGRPGPLRVGERHSPLGGPVGYWGKEGPELVAERARVLGDPDQTLVFGANTYRLMQRFHAESSDPGSSPFDEARKVPDIDLELVDSRTFDGRVQQLVYVPRGPWRH